MIRQFIANGLVPYASQHGHVQFTVIRNRDFYSHPKIIGYYVGGRVQVVPLKGKNEKQILDMCERLRQRSGRPLTMKRFPHAMTTKKSYQGLWSPDTWTQYPKKSSTNDQPNA